MNAPAYRLDGFERFVITVNGIDCVRYEIGQGPPLVYFHGGGTYHGFDWARDLAGAFRVILPYHPNFGESGDADFRDIRAYVDHYAQLFPAIGLSRFRLAGASMGGFLAAAYAAQHVSQIEALALAAPAGLSHPDAPVPDFQNIAPQDLPGMLVTDRAFIDPYWPLYPSANWLALRIREGTASTLARGDDSANERRLRAEWLPRLAMPVLLLWGERDRILPLPQLGEWRAALPHARSRIIPAGGHLLLDEFPSARAALLDFLLGEEARS